MIIEAVGSDEEAFREVAEFLLPMVREVALSPMDFEKASRMGYDALAQGRTFVAREAVGMPILGSIAMVLSDFWYSNQDILVDRWFYVRQDVRFGQVGVKLLRAAKRSAEEAGMLAFVHITNPDRRRKRTEAGLFAEMAGFIPFSHSMRLR